MTAIGDRETIAAALGALKAGAAYSPLDGDSPVLRLGVEVEELRAPVLVIPAGVADRLPGLAVCKLALDPDWSSFAGEDSERPELDLSPSDVFAVIFTSGSTGRPKGAALEHQSMLNLLRRTAHLAPGPGEGSLQVCAPQFDVGAYEVWATLLAGGRLVCHRPGRPEPADVCATVAEHDVSWAAMATGIFHQLVEHGAAPLAGMRMVLVGGEQLLPRYVRRFRGACPNVRLFNIYGPTETTVFVCAHELGAADETAERVPIGRPLAGARHSIRDAQGVPVPTGARGELYVGGPVLARGYLHRPALTAEKFVRDSVSGERFYRTGDLVCERGDGELEIVGRLDDQVKLRGYRVEPGEVEAQLAAHPLVSRAAVIARQDVSSRHRLVAYFVSANGPLDESTLRADLATRLPDYMIPSAFVALEQLPLTARGKLDRRALSPPSAAERRGLRTLAPLAHEIARIFAELLGAEAVDPDQDFLALGCDSLLAVQALARLREAHGIELPVAAVFEARSATELAARAARASADEPCLPPLRLGARPRSAVLPATAGQAKALLIGELAEESLPYQSQAVHRILGTLDAGALQRALTAVVRRHEILRTTFELVDGVWRQRIHEPAPVRLDCADLSATADPERALGELAAERFRIRLDPGRLPLAQWSLARLAHDDHALISLEHHVVHDGVSTARFLEEVAALYAAELGARPGALAEPSIQYQDFARWQGALASSASGRATLEHWRARLAGAPGSLPLPLDTSRPSRQTYRGATLRMTLSSELSDELERRARSWGTTPFVVMLAAYCGLLGRYAAVDEVVVGSGLANRRTVLSERLLGMLVNTVALRVDLGGAPTVAELVERVHATVLDAQAHQDVPFEQVVEHLAPARSTSAAPLYQTLFSFHDAPVRTLALPGAVLVPRDALANGSAKADLNVVVIRRRGAPTPGVDPAKYGRVAEDGVTVVWEYNSDLFARESAERMLGHYCRLLEQIAAVDDGRPVQALALTASDERERLLALAGRTVPYERDSTIAEVFAARVAERREAVAISCDGRTLSYWQLERSANRLANRLRQWGIARGSRVGVCIERSVDMVVAFLAVAKAGAAYVPLDPADPRSRLRSQLAALDIRLVLTHARHRELLPGPPERTVCLDDAQDLPRESDTAPPATAGPCDPVYVMFTSGSTGAPRGVEVPHRAVLRLVRGADYVALGPQETMLALSPPAFDAATFELWGALLNGGKVVIAPAGPLSTSEIAELLQRERVSTLWLTAGLFHRIVDDRPELLGGLRQLLAGGDVLSADHVRRALRALPPGAVMINGYGPTEGDDVHLRASDRAGRGGRCSSADRSPDLGHAGVRARSGRCSGADRRGGRAVDRWRRRRARLRGRSRVDGSAVRARSVRERAGRSDVPQRRSGALARGRGARIPWARRPPAQGSRLSRRAGRD